MIFWKLFLAHLLSDFVLQTEVVAQNKTKPKFLLLHCLVFLSLSILILLPSFSWVILFTLGALSVSHGLIDYLKILFERRYQRSSWVIFLTDQLFHLLAIGGVAFLLDRAFFFKVLEKAGFYWSKPSTFLVFSFFFLIVFGGSFFISILCEIFAKSLDTDNKPGILKAGRYIGMLERSLILLAVLLNKLEMVGYIFAAKSIIRYPEMKKETNFAEYYLIGTFTSISIAVFGGLLLKYLLLP